MLLKTARIGSLLISLLISYFTGSFGSLQWLWVFPLCYVGIELGILLLGFCFLLVICHMVDLDKPQEHDSPFYRFMLNLVAESALDLLRTRIHTEGLEKVPDSGRCLVVCNHLSVMDPVLVIRYLGKLQLAFISKKENKTMWLVGKLMHKTMCQMIDRDNDRAALKTILRCIQLIKEDEVSICVFPEGYTSRDGRLQHFRPGAFKIATKAKVPIVVCSLKGTQKILPSAAHLKTVSAEFHVLGVITPEQYEGHTAVEISEGVHQWILRDLGPDFAPLEADNT